MRSNEPAPLRISRITAAREYASALLAHPDEKQ